MKNIKTKFIIVLSIACTFLLSGIVYAATFNGTTLSLSGGESANFVCNGSSLAYTQTNATSGQTICKPAVPISTTGTTRWQPGAQQLEWQWYLAGAFDVNNNAQNGTGKTAYNGDTATNPTVYDIDGIENSAAEVSAIHAKGFKAICYVEVGTTGDNSYYSLAQENVGAGGTLTSTYYDQLKSAGDLGSKLSGYNEWFINVNASSAVSIIENMIQQQCANKGFDAVETDLDETYNNNEGSTGFTITKANEETYMTTLANYMHGLNLSWVAKNLDDTGDSYAADMASTADLALTEQCNQYGTCAPYKTGVWLTKPVLNAEYGYAQGSYCPVDNASTNISGTKFNTSLSGTRVPCK